MRSHFTSNLMAKIKSDNTECCRGCQVTGSVLHDWGQCLLVQTEILQFEAGHSYTQQTRNFIPRYLSKRNLSKDAHSSLVCNIKNW